MTMEPGSFRRVQGQGAHTEIQELLPEHNETLLLYEGDQAMEQAADSIPAVVV